MKNPINAVRRTMTEGAKRIAYSPNVRNAARTVLTSDAAKPVRKILADKGWEGHLQRFMSESLPEDKYFAKLTVENWEQFNGQSFRLYHGSRIVYGNEIEPPARGFPLEYRNLIVTSADVSDFTLDIDSPYTLQIGKGAFTTPQQVSYDKQYGVEQHGDVFYSMRGNTTSPKKLFITFPGFGPSTSRISYAVSYLKGVTEVELSDTLMVCFQDRYLAAGSYMLVDNAGRSLVDRINKVIQSFVDRHNIPPDQILFFGASKGGSIAVQYADHFPEAQLLLAVPQMHLKYYLDKPFFKDNIYNESGMHSVPQPESLIRRYFDEGRRIDYFYTNADEQSNFSLIEAVTEVTGLRKYRVDGNHGDVAKKALPTMMGIIRRFLSDGHRNNQLMAEDIRIFDDEDTVGVQIRIDDAWSPSGRANWYLQNTLGRTQFLQMLTDHDLPFIKYTNPDQRLIPNLDRADGDWTLVAVDESGDHWEGSLPEQPRMQVGGAEEWPLSTGKLRLDANTPLEHFIVSGSVISTFAYMSRRGIGQVNAIDIYVVDDINEIDLAEYSMNSESRFVAAIETDDLDLHLAHMIDRLSVISACDARNVSDLRSTCNSEVDGVHVAANAGDLPSACVGAENRLSTGLVVSG